MTPPPGSLAWVCLQPTQADEVRPAIELRPARRRSGQGPGSERTHLIGVECSAAGRATSPRSRWATVQLTVRGRRPVPRPVHHDPHRGLPRRGERVRLHAARPSRRLMGDPARSGAFGLSKLVRSIASSMRAMAWSARSMKAARTVSRRSVLSSRFATAIQIALPSRLLRACRMMSVAMIRCSCCSVMRCWSDVSLGIGGRPSATSGASLRTSSW